MRCEVRLTLKRQSPEREQPNSASFKQRRGFSKNFRTRKPDRRYVRNCRLVCGIKTTGKNRPIDGRGWKLLRRFNNRRQVAQQT